MSRRRRTDPAHFIGPDPERDVEAEIDFHLETAAAALRAAGVPPEAARRRAEREFGNVSRSKLECRAIDSRLLRRRDRLAWLDALRTDIRYALRTIRRSPAFAAVMVLTTGFALGFAALVGSALRGLLLRPLPFPDAGQLVWVFGAERESGTRTDRVTNEEVQALRATPGPFAALALFGDRGLVRLTGDRPARWTGLRVTPGLPAVLGIRPALGRAFTAADAASDAAVIMVGYERWQRDFGGDPGLIGRTLSFYDSKQYTVVGVLPPALEFPLARSPLTGGFGSGVHAGVQDFWLPMREESGGTLLGRLRPGATRADADRFVGRVAGRLAAEHLVSADRSLGVVPLRTQILGVAAPALRLLIVAAVVVLLLALANLANLTTARAHARGKDFTLRLALGGRPASNARILLTETALLSFAGMLLGLGLALGGLRLFARLAHGRLPLAQLVRLDIPVLGFVVGAGALLTAGLVIVPMLFLRGGASPVMAQGSGKTRAQLRVRRLLVASQVAMALLLLAGEAAVLQSLRRLTATDLGFEPARVIAVDLDVYRHPGGRMAYAEMVRRVGALPGVASVGAIHSIPLTGKWVFREPLLENGTTVTDTSARLALGNFVAFDYFGTMGIPLRSGRGFTAEEFQQDKPEVLIINETAAARFFAGRAVGAVVHLAGTDRTIIGVVKDTRDARLDLEPEPQWYLPSYFAGSQLMIRTEGEPSSMIQTIRRVLEAADPALVVHRIERLQDIALTMLFERRLASTMLGVVGALATLIAAVGLYGVLNYLVGERRHELGIRMAVGASPRGLLAMVLREGLGVATLGIAAGLLLMLPLSGAVTGLLYQARPAEPLVVSTVVGGVLLVTLVACLGPAWRASRIDPVVVLKAE